MPTQQTTSPGQKPANPTDRVPTLRGLSGDRLGSRTPNSPRNQRSDAHKLRKSGYTLVTSATNVSAEVPTALGFDVKATDRDVILAKANLPSDELSWTNPRSASFSTNLTFSTVAGPLTFTRGYNVADFTANKRSFRLVNTHLEAFSNFIRSAQAAELVTGVLGDATQKQVMLGDIN